MSDLKIIYASTIDVSLPNGPGVNEREFVMALRRRFGDKVGFVLPEPRNRLVLADLPNCSLFRVWPKRLHHMVAEAGLFWKLFSLSRNNELQLIISRCGLLPLGLAAFALTTRTPIALKTHGDPTLKYLCDSGGAKGAAGKLLRPASLALSRFLVRRAIRVDFCTPQLVDRNLKCHPGVEASKFIMVGNATNVDRFKPAPTGPARESLGLPQRWRLVGYVGGVPWERGGRQILRAVAELAAEFPDIGCAIVGGKGAGLDSLKSLARELGVEDRCVLPGEVPYDQVPSWVNSFDIGVAMDLPERAGYVGSSNQKIRQYLACGKPVIAAAGVNEFLEEHGLGVTVAGGDQAGFRDAVRKYLVESPGEKESRSSAARRYAEDFFSVDYTLSQRIQAWDGYGEFRSGAGAAA